MRDKKVIVIPVFILITGILLGIGICILVDKRDAASRQAATENVAGGNDTTAEGSGITETAAATEAVIGENVAEASAEDTAEETEEETEEATLEELSVADDKAPPMFLRFSESCEIEQGELFDIQKYVGYGDDVDRNPELSVEGTVDTSTLGTYPLTLTLKDEAGHTTTAKMNVKVVTKLSSYKGGSKYSFEKFRAKNKTEKTAVGIDVSRWQEDIDFEKVKEAGCEFVIIRIGGYDDGKLYEDRYFKTNLQNAKAAGLLIGIYWHAEESSIQEIKDSVAYLTDILDGEMLDFPIAYDWEDFGKFQKYGMNLHDLNACFEVFCEEIDAAGYSACLYSSKNFLEKVWTNPNRHPVWLANYTSNTTYEGAYYMWQQRCTGKIPGIDGDVDLDIWYK